MSAVTLGISGVRILIAENCSQVMSSMTETGTLRGVRSNSRSSRACLSSSSGTKWARVFSVSPGSCSPSFTTSRRKLGRLEARIWPFRSTIRPRGGGTRRKLNWLEAESF